MEEEEEPITDCYLLKEMILAGEQIPPKTSFSHLFNSLFDEAMGSEGKRLKFSMKKIMRAEVFDNGQPRSVEDVMKGLKLR